MKRTIILVLALLVLYLLFWPVPIEPKKYNAKAIAPKALPHAQLLSVKESIGPLPGVGPEDLVIGNNGQLYTGLSNGKLVKINLKTKTISTIATLPGQILGLELYQKHYLLAAVVNHGFYKINLTTGVFERVIKKDFGFEEAIAVLNHNVFYLTDGSRFNVLNSKEQQYAALEPAADGKLYQYKDQKLKMIQSQLDFANGISANATGDALIISDMFKFRLLNYQPRTNTLSVFAKHLPGYPDNISLSQKGLLWVAIYSPPVKGLAKLAQYPFVRKVMARIPRFLLPKAQARSWALAYDDQGDLIKAYKIKGLNITSVAEYQGTLYFGTLQSEKIYKARLQ